MLLQDNIGLLSF